jgi:hypothetical protein
MGTSELAILAVLIVVAAAGIARFELFCLRDLAQTADVDLNYLTRPGWAALIVLAIPLGGATYLCYGKRRMN